MKSTLIKLTITLFTGYMFAANAQAQNEDLKESISLKAIPYTLEAFNSPLNIEVKNDSSFVMTSGAKTNLFNSPGDNYYKQDAPMLLFQPDSNFIFRAKVEADLQEVYDVAALVLYQNNDLWAKLCFENSINKEALVVSVVTNRFSDDCNSFRITNNFIFLAIAKKGDEFSFHCSTDNVNWQLIRHFRMEFSPNDLKIGFAVHCSREDQFTAEFSEISYLNEGLENMRRYR